MTFCNHIYIIGVALLAISACNDQVQVKEEDKIFHAGPVNSGFSAIFFGLYKENKYQFCDGDFMDDGCYTGKYSLSGDTIIFNDLRKHGSFPTNRFLICRYTELDSTYWIRKFPKASSWREMKERDLSLAEGDILPLNEKNKTVLISDNYFLIRLDSLKKR